MADIHSNLPALEAVLTDFKEEYRRHPKEIWCLGDLVGYGPWPDECVAELRKRKAVCVAGNHDLVEAGTFLSVDDNDSELGGRKYTDGTTTIEISWPAAKVDDWSQTRMSAENKEFLRNLPLHRTLNDTYLVHSRPSDPVGANDVLGYLTLPVELPTEVKCLPPGVKYCFYAHSHAPLVLRYGAGRLIPAHRPKDTEAVNMADEILFVNPGSVGLSRDPRDWRASYVAFDRNHQTLIFHRVKYNVEETLHKLREAHELAGYPAGVIIDRWPGPRR
jgi:predicted phosphodiesterase